MKVSILIPTLNRLNYLKESLASARQQRYPDLEILVSDDGSTDGSRELVSAVMEEDRRVRLLPPNPQPGLFENVNYLVRNASGEAFCILGDDDILFPEFVGKLVSPLNDEQIVASFCDHWLIDAGGGKLAPETERHAALYGRQELIEGVVSDPLTQAMRGSMCMGFSLYRARVFKEQLFDLSCGGAADFDYAIRAAMAGKLYFVKERLGSYRVHPATATATRPNFLIDGIIKVYSKHSFTEPRHERLRRELLRDKYRIKALHVCTLDRREWLRSMRCYRALGGRLLSPRAVLSFLFAALPRPLSPRTKLITKKLHARWSRVNTDMGL